MLDNIPNDKEMIALIGQPLFNVWTRLCNFIDVKYDMEHLWNKGYRDWVYEYKYRRGGKTLCTFYAMENRFSLLVILGREERVRFEAHRNEYSKAVQKLYDETKTYHDGKWLLLDLTDDSFFPDIEKLLLLKRKPNKK
ncbi:DUF3788 domain-containing protein [Sedimentibacter sp.]|uniref:DUF3788 domain-containing protein n=1 Tax=Sedimentibacter sp. TaxID=1960295 RepID=UPI0028A9BBD2|nr:DUF3788 domain-containing protein [Sedimentibacter sp.]